MNLNDFAFSRLAIAMKALRSDPSVSEILKSTLGTLHQCLEQHQHSLDLFEKELLHRPTLGQMQLSVNQKLSINEFMQHFQKVELVVQRMESHSLKEKEDTIEWNSRKSKEQQAQLINIANRIASLEEQLQKLKVQAQLPVVAKNTTSETKLWEEIKCIQSYCQEMNGHLQAAVQDLGKQSLKYLWQWEPDFTCVRMREKGKNNEFKRITVGLGGLYRVSCGALPVNEGQGWLRVLIDGQQVASETITSGSAAKARQLTKKIQMDQQSIGHLKTGATDEIISRTISLHCYIQQGSQLALTFAGSLAVQGFIELVRF